WRGLTPESRIITEAFKVGTLQSKSPINATRTLIVASRPFTLKTLPIRALPLLASPRRFAVVPILRHGRPSPWANTESSRITVAECFGFQTWIIVNWRYSTASARQPAPRLRVRHRPIHRLVLL